MSERMVPHREYIDVGRALQDQIDNTRIVLKEVERENRTLIRENARHTARVAEEHDKGIDAYIEAGKLLALSEIKVSILERDLGAVRALLREIKADHIHSSRGTWQSWTYRIDAILGFESTVVSE